MKPAVIRKTILPVTRETALFGLEQSRRLDTPLLLQARVPTL
jgi:hypothetical protein